jgi:ParB-like chromosome segregation protein Spo0J
MVPTDDLVPYARNSRTHSSEQVIKIAASIEEFGFLNPVIIDGDKGIIAGHGRVMAAKHLELAEVPTLEASHLTEEQKKAYVIADNRLALDAGWDEKTLMKEILDLQAAEFDLALTGFNDNEIAKILGEQEKEVDGQVVFSEEVGEAHNYVVLYFDNDLDWLSAQTHFDLKSVHSKRANGKPWSKGIGRVVNGADYLKKLKQ